MSEDNSNGSRLEKLVRRAAGAVVGSEQSIGYRQAMTLVGFKPEEVSNAALYKRVIRRSKALTASSKLLVSTPAVTIQVAPAASSISSLTNGSSGTPAIGTPPLALGSPLRALLEVEPLPIKAKRERRSVKELQRSNAKSNAAKERQKAAFKVATNRIKRSLELPVGDGNRKTIRVIVDEVNEVYQSNVNSQTAARYVRKGMAGMSPLKSGPVGDFPKAIYHALKGAFSTYLKLEQASAKKQSTINQLVKLVNTTVNAGGFNKRDNNLTRKLRKDTAGDFEVGKVNMVERRRLMWTTAYHIDTWYSTFKTTLIDLGFAREKEDTDLDTVGELFFYPGQLQRILNFDETDGSIDDTNGKRGGRPPSVFHSNEVSGGATAANKSSYTATIIFGSNAAGEPLPPHFQLKSTAQTAETQRLSTEWFKNVHSILVRFGFGSKQERPCTFGMNEKAGMNALELHKYIENSILPLYPDMEDVPGKRVLMKVDSGPGRTNLNMLAQLRLIGCYLVPGVPNTTAVTQETDQNYGPFKGAYRDNIRKLTQGRFDNSLSMRVTDLPLLVFGGVCERTGEELVNSFQTAFNIDLNQSAWLKCGAVPLTRTALKARAVRHEIPVMAALNDDTGLTDSVEIRKLKELDQMNCYYCQILATAGFNGEPFRIEAPTRKKIVAVSKPNSLERIEALRKATTAGGMFHATGGGHINSDDFFKAAESKARDARIKAMEDIKKERMTYCDSQFAAIRLIQKKGELTHETVKNFTMDEIKKMLRWKRIKPSGTLKRDLVQAYIDTPKPQRIQTIWSRREEAELVALKNKGNITLETTALGVAAIKMMKTLQNSMVSLDQSSCNELQAMMEAKKERDNPNAL
jgi:hypothetical protein